MRACRRLCSTSRSLLQVSELQCGSRFASAASVGRVSAPCSSRTFTTSAQTSSVEKSQLPAESNLPSKGTLLRVDWMLEHMLPGLMKTRLKPFFDIVADNLQFEDKLYGYKHSSRSSLFSHIAKIRLYFRYKSPYNKVEYVGSCVYEGEDVVVLLWRLSYLESSLLSYLPAFLTQKEPKIAVMEGALDMHITKDGHVYKIVNRKVTASDLEGAKVMAALKKEQGDRLLEEDEREWRRKVKEEFEAERMGRL
ncbi:hypothetical protein PRIPAC_71076 [Pristionchus pacificus]|uniref:Uncharacterized protein n=1 Tax=Pristionchus pacificus TaxID=54126 RepID=A0A2A6C992_PRIPA|nr:hypothetical protein PRIPAC_71076 [Pristionchus pacificus]|eukprot:PDM74623.1 hypothetical protein PRIPAC_41979 [Pristionchus pacificus]